MNLSMLTKLKKLKLEKVILEVLKINNHRIYIYIYIKFTNMNY